MGERKENDYYFDCDVTGHVAVVVTARNKREALAKFREAIWSDRYDVSLKEVLPKKAMAQKATDANAS